MQSKFIEKELLIHRLKKIIFMIDEVSNDLAKISFEDFKKSSVIIRASCFSLSQIGETMNNIEKKIGKAYPNIPWKNARDMRNLLVHDYDHVNEEIVYKTSKEDLPLLKKSLLALIDDLEKGLEIPC